MDDTLIERLEAASEGSRELDDEIATVLFTDKHRTCIKGLSDEAGGTWMFRYPNGSIGSSLRFTASLDAAMTLGSLATDPRIGGASGLLHEAMNRLSKRFHLHITFWPDTENYTEWLARFMCAAALRAQAGEKS